MSKTTEEEWTQAFIQECERYQGDLEQRFPGMRATDYGIQYDGRARETMKDWLT